MDLFAKIVCSLKSITMSTRSSILKIYYWVLKLLQVFFQIYIYYRPFISPNILKDQLNVNSAHKCLFKVYTRSIALSVGLVQIWYQGYHNNICHVLLRFWLTLGRSLHYILVLLLLTLNILYLLWVSLNATLWHIFVEHQIGVIFIGVVAKH